MAKQFDSATKELIELGPADWLAYTGLPIGPVTPFDADLATVTTEADRVLRVGTATPYIAHLEMQASYKSDMIERFLRYHVLLRYRYRLPVRTVVILLRHEADHPQIDGVFHYDHPGEGEPTITFRYAERVLREVMGMEESATYQAILAKGEAKGRTEGRTEEARNLLLLIGGKRFGSPTSDVIAAISAIPSVERLEQMATRLFEVETWDELLVAE